ncbi:MAG: efflux RND transporter permease subunit [Candidatus Omnitrophota bacterium]
MNEFNIGFYYFFGIYSLFTLRLEAFPSVDYDMVIITTIYKSAPAEDVEKLVTIPIEEELIGISGIKEIESSSDEGLSSIAVTIDPDYSDKEQVIDDIERAVDRAKNLPDEIEDDPTVTELRISEYPILEVALAGNDIPEHQMREYGVRLEDALQDVAGVATVKRIGWRDPEFWVEIDPKKAEDYHVSPNEVAEALDSHNINFPAGILKGARYEYNVRTVGEFETKGEIEDVIIRANDDGNWLKVKDIAVVKDTFERRTHITRIAQKNALAMLILKSENADILEVVANVNKVIDKFQTDLPDNMRITVTDDMSFYVKRRLGVLKNNGLFGFVLVLIVLFVFLDPVPALTTAMGIPIALFVTFILMHLFGITINLVSMLGLIIVLGMLVDDGIIVSENVYRYIESGMPPKEAAIKGTNEVIKPVIATVLTTFAAFAPLLFMKDIMGKFIKAVPIVVIFALSASILEAFIILPSHLSDFVKGGKFNRIEHKRSKREIFFIKIQKVYTRILELVLKHRYRFVAGMGVIFVFAVCLMVFAMKIIMFKGEGIEQFYVRFEAEKGVNLEEMSKLVIPVEKLIEDMPKNEIDEYRTYIGSIESEKAGFDPNAKKGTHLGQITVFLTPMQKRKRTPHEIAADVREKLKSISGFEKIYVDVMKEGPPMGKDIELGVVGDNFQTSYELAQDIEKYLNTVDGVSDVVVNYQKGKKQMRVVVDENEAKKYYLDINSIAYAVRAAFDGVYATAVKPKRAEKEIDVIVKYPQGYCEKKEDFGDILVENSKSNLVPLRSVARVEEVNGLYLITHLEGKRVIYVLANVDSDKITSFQANKLLRKKFDRLDAKYSGCLLNFGGEYEDQKESQRNLFVSFLFAIFLIFIILTAIFKSLLQPLIVMLAIPFGIVGVILAFFLHNEPLSFFALMGLVGLTGIVVNDSVVLVDFINKLRKDGKDRRSSLVEAGRTRLRPVLMTTITTIGGLVSVAYGIGGGDPFLKPMGLAIIWGLFFATVLTLLLIPCIYAIFDDISIKFLHHPTVSKDDRPS